MIGFAWFILLAWPVVSFVFFKKLALPLALCLTTLVGYILLPNGLAFNPPLLPAIDKQNIFVLSALAMTALFVRSNADDTVILKGWIPRDMVTRVILVMLLLSFFATALANDDPLVFGPLFIPGLSVYDAFSEVMTACLMVAPLFVARKVLSSSESQRVLLVVLAFSGLMYSLPALYEVRMSPHLHSLVYGYWHDSFIYYLRAGGYRPAVFMGNGLELGIYTVFSLLAIVCLMRTSKEENRLMWMLAFAWMAIAFVLYKTLGALLIAVVLVPCVLLLNPRTQLLIAFSIVVVILIYPVLRTAHLIPVEEALALADRINPARAGSLNVRFENEEMLLAKAQERPLFGWGSWGRNRVYTDWGRDTSLTDGQWIVQLGTGGWMRYISVFGLLCWPIIKMFLFYRQRVDYVTAGLVLILCAKLLDMIPNAGQLPLIWMIAGALLGRMEILAGRKPLSSTGVKRDTVQYARHFPEIEAQREAQTNRSRGLSARADYKRPHTDAGCRK